MRSASHASDGCTGHRPQHEVEVRRGTSTPCRPSSRPRPGTKAPARPRGAAVPEEPGQRPHLVAGLDLLDVVQIVRAEQLRPVEGKDERRFAGRMTRDDALRLSRPSSPDRRSDSCRPVPGGPRADVGEVVRVGVNELDRDSTGFRFDLRDREHHRLRPQVQVRPRVWRVGVGGRQWPCRPASRRARRS